MNESRREYGQAVLDESQVASCALVQFEVWLSDALNAELDDPTAMVLSTVDSTGRPDSRVVLLKGLELDSFVFYTNYDSVKACQIGMNAKGALNFYWPKLVRQVRVRGDITRTTDACSDAYFASRPRMSQLGALASHQSHVIPNRTVLEAKLSELELAYQDKPIPRPLTWGGFALYPHEIEFWQGRDNRLHDRLHYKRLDAERWQIMRLAP